MAFAPISPLTTDGFNKFLSMTYHQFINHAVYTFARLGIADRLIHAPSDRGFTVEEIIGDDRKQWNSQLLYRVVRTCVYAGIVLAVNDDKHFLLTPSGMMMTSDHPAHVRDQILFTFGPLLNNTYEELSNIVRGEGTGTGVARVSGGLNLYELLNDPNQKELVSMFNGAMVSLSYVSGNKLVAAVDFDRFKTIADIGGNRGAFLSQILQFYPAIERGIVFDILNVVNQCKDGEEFTSREISKDRWSFVAGDMFEPSTIPLADAYVLKYILHNYKDEKCVEILSSIREANKNRQRSAVSVFIIELIILPDGALSNWQVHGMDVVMASLFGDARERTVDEYKDLLQRSGLEFKKLHPLEAPHSIIEAALVQ